MEDGGGVIVNQEYAIYDYYKPTIMKDKEIIELMKTGEFTLAYHDNGSCSLYKGKFSFDDDNDEVESLHEFDCDFEGYLPKEVALLVKSLGGKSESI